MKLGTYLKDKREKSGITLKEMQERSGIRKDIIKQLETGDFNNLPDPRHARFLIRQYTVAIGLDGEALMEKHADEFADEAVESKKRQQNDNEDYQYLKKVLISFMIMIAVLFVGWMILLQIGSQAEIFDQKPVYDVGQTEINEEETADEEQTGETAQTEEDTEEETAEEPSGADYSFTGSDGNTLFYDINADGPVTISLEGENASWVTLTDDAGNTYAYEELTEGEYEISEEANILYLTLGNAPGFNVEIDGETLDDSQSGDAVTVYYQFNIVKE
ncbi:helix-turn-helix domain-containing protein [Salinicoccus carnicancri]|uniref:helix-turn-helix domain-containing protein n=1 Tax=Salinicoccus carnicancri TaxID=558170 RepID=UPI0002DF2C60|nr:RodZ domain-containing protein [Salinicoccus carnicancri]